LAPNVIFVTVPNTFTCTLPARSVNALETELRSSGLLARSDRLEAPDDD
jgi:hypothetical protein